MQNNILFQKIKKKKKFCPQDHAISSNIKRFFFLFSNEHLQGFVLNLIFCLGDYDINRHYEIPKYVQILNYISGSHLKIGTHT